MLSIVDYLGHCKRGDLKRSRVGEISSFPTICTIADTCPGCGSLASEDFFIRKVSLEAQSCENGYLYQEGVIMLRFKILTPAKQRSFTPFQ
jgi:hypothetical protein